ncbi:MAG TPA: TlpA disulfide reductase family protein [Chthonomonadales bacterium]|nr:TlpA disulfide reductase family protein [Chthonomonadales bacterium]
MRRTLVIWVVCIAAAVSWGLFEVVRLRGPQPLRAMEGMPPLAEGREFDPHSVLTRRQAAQQAPGIGLRGRHGLMRLGDQRGRVVLIAFWATWCAPCHMSIPMFQRLYEAQRANGFEVMGVALENADLGHIEAFARQMGMTYPIGFAESAEQVKGYPTEGLPTMVLVDRGGRVRLVVSGYDPALQEQLPLMVEALLAEQG